jgi:hypothetical protein
MPQGKKKAQYTISVGDEGEMILAQLRARYGAKTTAVFNAYLRLTDDPFRELAQREAPATEPADAPEVQEAEHAA